MTEKSTHTILSPGWPHLTEEQMHARSIRLKPNYRSLIPAEVKRELAELKPEDLGKLTDLGAFCSPNCPICKENVLVTGSTSILSKDPHPPIDCGNCYTTSVPAKKSIQGSVLSDKDIKAELGSGVIIYPFNENQLNGASYNITLGEDYFRASPNPPPYFSMSSGKHIANYWNLKPTEDGRYNAQKAEEVKTYKDAAMYGVNVGDKIILLKPGELILGCNREFIGTVGNITTEISARSTTGRTGRTVAKCAGLGDPGFFNIWTLEIEDGTSTTIVLKVGEPLGQITFIRTGEVEQQYHVKGQYQKSNNIEEVKASWNPKMMIPSAGIKYVDSMAKLVDKNYSYDFLNTRCVDCYEYIGHDDFCYKCALETPYINAPPIVALGGHDRGHKENNIKQRKIRKSNNIAVMDPDLRAKLVHTLV